MAWRDPIARANRAVMWRELQARFEKLACAVSGYAGRPAATVGAFLVVLAWAVAGPFLGFSAGWQLLINTGTTIITFLMVFLLQASQNRDGAAIQAKLDELLRAVDKARNDFIGIDHKTQDEIEAKREPTGGG